MKKNMIVRIFVSLSVLAAFGCIWPSLSTAGTVYDMAADWSDTNPNGVWSLGHDSAGGRTGSYAAVTTNPFYNNYFETLPTFWNPGANTAPAIYRGPAQCNACGFDTTAVTINDVIIAAGATAGVVSWTAPQDGTVDISWSYHNLQVGEMNFYINDSGVDLDSVLSVAGVGMTDSRDLNDNADLGGHSVSAGDVISLISDMAGDPSSDTSKFSFSIDFTPVPEPSSLVLLVFGAVACMLSRRRSSNVRR